MTVNQWPMTDDWLPMTENDVDSSADAYVGDTADGQ